METSPVSELSFNDKAEYLYQSIIDIQGTIRAIDAKVAAVLIILSLPFSVAGKILSRFCQIPVISSGGWETFLYWIFWVFCGAWLLSFIAALGGIMGIDDPGTHINKDGTPVKGSFYNAGLFAFPVYSAICRWGCVKASRTVSEQVMILPSRKSDLFAELAFEQMKVSYIRDLKQIRQYWAFRFTSAWLFLGLSFYVLTANHFINMNPMCNIAVLSVNNHNERLVGNAGDSPE